MHLLEALILDIDGTLVDSNDLHADCWTEAFAHFGKQIAWADVRSHVGKGGDLLVPDLLDAKEMRSFGEAVKSYRSELWTKSYMHRVQPFAGASAALERLAGAGIRLALASSADPQEVEHYVQLLGAKDWLDATTSKEDAQFSKPSPEIFRAALERIEANPERTVVVGDTPYDILAAHRAALPVAAVLSGGFPREELAKAEMLFDDIRAMVREIDRLDDYFRE